MIARQNSMLPAFRTLAIAAAAALVLTACGDDASSDPDTAEDPAAVSLERLDGRMFAGAEVTGGDVGLVRDSEIRLVFEGTELSAHAGCNHLAGTAQLEDGRLTVEQLSGTEMGCPDDLAAQDEWLSDLLAEGAEVSIADDTLTLSAGDTTIELAEETLPQGESDPGSDGDPTSTTVP